MWAIQFFVYALIVTLLALLFGGTMVGYYFQKKFEFEMKKLVAIGKAVTKAATDEKS